MLTDNKNVENETKNKVRTIQKLNIFFS